MSRSSLKSAAVSGWIGSVSGYPDAGNPHGYWPRPGVRGVRVESLACVGARVSVRADADRRAGGRAYARASRTRAFPVCVL